MSAKLVRMLAVALIVMTFGSLTVLAQEPQTPLPQVQAAAQFPPEQLEQMLAPIALYPDPLVAQILMAATYPLEVVAADRWLQIPGNAALGGEQLTATLQQLPWDPSVKSLVPFPQILSMMDGNLDWMESLGEAFMSNQAAVMDSVQRLRQRAQTAGTLNSTPQQVVSTEGPTIMIEPPSPDVVYVPVYDPMVVYGGWPYPGYPPFYFPDFFTGVAIGARGFGWLNFGIVLPLWGWNHWDWGHHRIDIDRPRFAGLDHDHQPIGGGTWEHDTLHRHGVPYQNPGLRAQFAANAGVQRNFRGYPSNGEQQSRQGPNAGPARNVGSPREASPPEPRYVEPHVSAPSAPRSPPTFESYGTGAEVREQADRGAASRMSRPEPASRGSISRPAPSVGGRRRP
jgi:hypothetical protein